MEFDLLDPDGFDSPAFGGQMVCSEVTVVGCSMCVHPYMCVYVCKGS